MLDTQSIAHTASVSGRGLLTLSLPLLSWLLCSVFLLSSKENTSELFWIILVEADWLVGLTFPTLLLFY